MGRIDKVKLIKTLYPVGTRVELILMNDPYTTLKAGDRGSVTLVDDQATIFVNWDCGSTLGLIPGEDLFRVVKP
jgi:hypothetical protein